jgi:hypothetical protein
MIFRRSLSRNNQAFPGFRCREFPYITAGGDLLLPLAIERGTNAVSDREYATSC